MNKTEFNKIATHPLQTWEWGEFREKWGNEVVRFPFGQITLHKLPLTNYKIGVLEKGPTPTPEMLAVLEKYAKDNKVLFIRLEPNIKTNEKTIELLKKNGCVPGRRIFTPSTFVIDLTPTEEDLLKSFTPKTRYNIRVAQKHGVEVVEDNSDQAFERYLALTKETAQRQGFYAHSEKYHRLMWQTLHKDPISRGEEPLARLQIAKFQGHIITTWILFVWKDCLYYPYGASTDKFKQVMANNLMLWEAIRLGQNLKLKIFDLWGREEGKGFTKFKEGYNPKVVNFIGTWDLIVSPWYYLYKILEKIRWFILKLFK
jgi:lipid II:glycine glycyltransferase (peptidoglycan interpeptide bridge formation enzyme)